METSAGSPRSSSGYGSSEEDHIRSSISAPQTPNSLSPLSSATIDLQTAFEYDDVIMPDFSDIGSLSDSTSKFYCLADDWSAVNTPPRFSSNDESSLALIDDHLTLASFAALDSASATTVVDDVLEASNNNILVSLLKQKSDVQSSAAISNRTPTDSRLSSSSESAGKSQQSSPLQRLRALTRGNVVNDTELAPVVRPRIVVSSSQNSVKLVKDSTDATATNKVLRVGIVATASERSAFHVRSPLLGGASSSSARTDPMPASTSGLSERKQAPLIADGGSTTRITTSHPSVANRRHRSELEDHRYSSLHPVPMMTSSTSSGASRRANGGLSSSGKRPLSRTTTSRLGGVVGRKTGSSSMLEALLLTNRTLNPNEGSEATLAACGVWSCANRGEIGSASCPGDDSLSTDGPQAKRSCGEGSLLEHLLTGRTGEKNSTSGSETVIVKCEPMDDDEDKMASDNFDLFNGQLLYDECPGDMHLGGLFGQDTSSVWTPAFFDEKVLSSELEEIMHQENRQEDAWLQHYLSDLL